MYLVQYFIAFPNRWLHPLIRSVRRMSRGVGDTNDESWSIGRPLRKATNAAKMSRASGIANSVPMSEVIERIFERQKSMTDRVGPHSKKTQECLDFLVRAHTGRMGDALQA